MMAFLSIFEEMIFFFSFRSASPDYSIHIDASFELGFSIWAKVNHSELSLVKIRS